MNELPTGTDYHAEVTAAIAQTRAAISEGLRLIADQEDGPFTMRCQIAEISDRLDLIESEVDRLVGAVERWERVAVTLQGQRDEALRQRDFLLTMFEQLYEDERDSDVGIDLSRAPNRINNPNRIPF